MKDESMLLGFGIAIALVGAIYGLGWLVRVGRDFFKERERTRARNQLTGADFLVRELATVERQRRLIEPKVERFRAFRDEVLATTKAFAGTQAESDLRLRARRVEEAFEDLQRACDTSCRLEAELRMQRGGLALVREIKEELAAGWRTRPEKLLELRSGIERLIWEDAHPSVRAWMGEGSSARKLLDDVHERLREHLAALWLRDFDASKANEMAIEPIEALPMLPDGVSGFEEELRELEAQTAAVLEVERMLVRTG